MVAFQRLHLFDALRVRGFQVYISSAFMVYAARWMQMTVLGWLTLELTNSALMVGLVNALQWAPMLLFGAVAGVMADRLNRRAVLIAVQFVTAGLYVALGFLIVAGTLQVWELMTITLLAGTCWALDWPCRRAVIPDLVGRENIVNAIAIDHSAGDGMGAIGAIVGGQLITAIGMGNCYYLISVIYALSGAIFMLAPRINQTTQTGSVGIVGEVSRGVKYVFMNRVILGVLAVTIIMNGLIFPYRTLLPIFARDILTIGPGGLGLLMAASQIGALFGALSLATMGNVRRPGMFFLFGSLSITVALVLFAVSRLAPLSVLMLVLAGAAMALFGTFQSTILLHQSSGEMRGRVMGLLSLAIGAMPLGISAFGAIANVVYAPIVVGVGATLAALLTASVLFLIPQLRKTP